MGLWCDQMGVGGWIAMIALWAVLLALVVWAVCRIFPTRRESTGGEPDPQVILDARLASGDLDPETYRSLRSYLNEPRPTTAKGPR